MVKKSDEGFVKDLLKKHGGKNTGLKKRGVKDRKTCFTIHHYAGSVQYDADGFLIATADSLPHDLQQLVHTCKDQSISQILCSGQSHGSSGSSNSTSIQFLQRSRSRKSMNKQKATLASKFRKQLGNLVKMLKSTSSHFIRCLKPNHTRSSGTFDARMILTQLRQLGLQAVCDVRRMGYNCRQEFQDFVCQYAICLSLVNKHSKMSGMTQDIDEDDEDRLRSMWKNRAEELIADLNLAQYWTGDELVKVLRFGRTRLFMKEVVKQKLQQLRCSALDSVVIPAQALVRRFIARIEYLQHQRRLTQLRKAIEKRDLEDIINGLNETQSLPHRGEHISLVVEARELRDLLHKQEQQTGVLEEMLTTATNTTSSVDMIELVDTEDLRLALERAKSLQMEEFEVFKKAERLFKRLLEIEECLKVNIGHIREINALLTLQIQHVL